MLSTTHRGSATSQTARCALVAATSLVCVALWASHSEAQNTHTPTPQTPLHPDNPFNALANPDFDCSARLDMHKGALYNARIGSGGFVHNTHTASVVDGEVGWSWRGSRTRGVAHEHDGRSSGFGTGKFGALNIGGAHFGFDANAEGAAVFGTEDRTLTFQQNAAVGLRVLVLHQHAARGAPGSFDDMIWLRNRSTLQYGTGMTLPFMFSARCKRWSGRFGHLRIHTTRFDRTARQDNTPLPTGTFSGEGFRLTVDFINILYNHGPGQQPSRLTLFSALIDEVTSYGLPQGSNPAGLIPSAGAEGQHLTRERFDGHIARLDHLRVAPWLHVGASVGFHHAKPITSRPHTERGRAVSAASKVRMPKGSANFDLTPSHNVALRLSGGTAQRIGPSGHTVDQGGRGRAQLTLRSASHRQLDLSVEGLILRRVLIGPHAPLDIRATHGDRLDLGRAAVGFTQPLGAGFDLYAQLWAERSDRDAPLLFQTVPTMRPSSSWGMQTKVRFTLADAYAGSEPWLGDE